MGDKEMSASADRYTGGAYLAQNPDWHAADSPWKAQKIVQALRGATPRSICDVGCGVGGVLRQLHDHLPSSRLVGYEVAPAAFEMAQKRSTDRLSFSAGDAADYPETFDLMLILDVVEHVADPVAFLASLRFKSPRALMLIPLDLSVQSVLRPQKLAEMRRRLGHIHYFTPETALATIQDAGYEIERVTYIAAALELPAESKKAHVARVVRRILPPKVAVRLLGGYELLVVASSR